MDGRATTSRPLDLALDSVDLRILVLAPTSNDARLSAQFLAKIGLAATVCRSLDELRKFLNAGCGALLIAEEALVGDAVVELAEELERQPSWSDLPVILITAGADGSRLRSHYLAALAPVGNISIIERPVRPETLVSTCEVALRSRRRQYQVRDLLRALDAADRRKDEFLAMLAHELRNPLAAVANAASLLNAGAEEREWASEVIVRQSSQLAHLIDDLLDVSRITAGKIRLRKETLDAATILDRATDSVRALVAARNHNLVSSYVAGCLWVEADPTRLEQIVLNLLTNAAKYTPVGGRIELLARLSGTEVVITVRDNGIGIAPERIPDMFQLFAQGERSIARSEGGLGIGLTIVQKLVEMHGGRIETKSDGPNSGSTFSIWLPAAPKPAATNGAHKTPCPATQGRRVLIVDDNVDTAQSLGRLLTRVGHEIALAHDGLQAVERACEQAPDAVVLDIGLPGMDGFEVAQRLRGEAGCEDAVIIAVTGYGQPEDREKSLEAGFDHHLVKPVEFDELNRLLSKQSLRRGARTLQRERRARRTGNGGA
jgi:signal transduction histidine kinase/ActR/RegA family two-component response regulator